MSANVWAVDVWQPNTGWTIWTEWVDRATAEAERDYVLDQVGCARADTRIRRCAESGGVAS